MSSHALDRTIPFYNLILRCGCWQRRKPSLPEGFSLRGYQPGDEEAWAALEYEIGDFDTPEAARDYFAGTYCAAPGELEKRCLFAIDGQGRVAGTCTAWRDRRGAGEIASLHWLAVSPAHQGKGLGKALCRGTLEIFQDLGEFPVYIHTQPWSWKALLLYMREGFRLQKTDTFGAYTNQYELGMEALRAVLSPEQYREAAACSEE